MNVGWYPAVLKKYATFQGRAGREEFWVYALFNFLIFFSFYLIAFLSHAPILLVLYWICTLAVLPASLAVGARRLHDTGKSGWYLLLELVPFGAIVLIVFWVEAGQSGPNAYGVAAPRTPDEPIPAAPMNAPFAPPFPHGYGAAPLAAAAPPPPPASAAPSFCSHCGTSLPNGTAFCTSCGAHA
jgi:uncharacterized membrane protein YhaH (DUF805 family)